MSDKVREGFEAWYRAEFDCEPDPDGVHSHGVYQVWQAAHAAGRREGVEEARGVAWNERVTAGHVEPGGAYVRPALTRVWRGIDALLAPAPGSCPTCYGASAGPHDAYNECLHPWHDTPTPGREE